MSKSSSTIYVVGRTPPPVTGENLCRRHLIETLNSFGLDVEGRARMDWRNLFIFRSRVWILSGATRHGHLRDVFFMAWWLLLGSCVSVYIHNASWQYFKGFSSFWRIWGRRVRFIVLTERIESALNDSGLIAFRLNNTLCDGIEQGPVDRRFVPRFIWMSSVCEAKGFDTAYGIFEEMKRHDAAWRFDVYGGGPLVDTTRFPMANFHGFTSGAGKDDALAAGGIFLLPSRYVNETQPLAIIEALNNGLPFLATDVGGIPDMIGTRGEPPAGVCLPVGSPIDRWRQAVDRISSDYERFSIAALSCYQAHFSRSAFSEAARRLVSL